ncbi:hypothetical protein L905_11910 [Agrobacterium sp. TS43]|nr:hypothetical protein L906_21950 [Agrobacterium sp. TS45]KVK66284.1 hypothetical protein L907_21910 [Agrobacterium sp. C13]KVK70243.1 hypothetical protein L905_11910 [Agrobacterium sp. TS43]
MQVQSRICENSSKAPTDTLNIAIIMFRVGVCQVFGDMIDERWEFDRELLSPRRCFRIDVAPYSLTLATVMWVWRA